MSEEMARGEIRQPRQPRHTVTIRTNNDGLLDVLHTLYDSLWEAIECLYKDRVEFPCDELKFELPCHDIQYGMYPTRAFGAPVTMTLSTSEGIQMCNGDYCISVTCEELQNAIGDGDIDLSQAVDIVNTARLLQISIPDRADTPIIVEQFNWDTEEYKAAGDAVSLRDSIKRNIRKQTFNDYLASDERFTVTLGPHTGEVSGAILFAGVESDKLDNHPVIMLQLCCAGHTLTAMASHIMTPRGTVINDLTGRILYDAVIDLNWEHYTIYGGVMLSPEDGLARCAVDITHDGLSLLFPTFTLKMNSDKYFRWYEDTPPADRTAWTVWKKEVFLTSHYQSEPSEMPKETQAILTQIFDHYDAKLQDIKTPAKPTRRSARGDVTKADIKQNLPTGPARGTLIRGAGSPDWTNNKDEGTTSYTNSLQKITCQLVVDPAKKHDIASMDNGSIIKRGNAANSRAMMYILDRLDAEIPTSTGEYAGVDIYPLMAARAIGRLKDARNGERYKGQGDGITETVNQIILDAAILGAGVTVYKKLNTGRKKDEGKSIEVPVWTIDHIKRAMINGKEEIEYIRVRMSGEFRGLVIDELRQMIGRGELLNELPTGQTGGAWAEVIALCLMDFWRREANKTRTREITLSRRELLTTIKPEKGDVVDMVSKRKHAERPAIYWADALEMLAAIGFIARDDDTEWKTAQDFKATGKVVPVGWLDDEVLIRPGHVIIDEIARVKRPGLQTDNTQNS